MRTKPCGHRGFASKHLGGGGARSHTQTAKAAEWSQSLQLSRWTQFLDSLVAVVIPLVCCGIIDLLVLVVSAIAVVLAP